MRGLPVVMGLMCALTVSCGGPAATDAALATFERFQDALFAQDATAVGGLVTEESRPVIEAMPWNEVQRRQRLVPVEASDRRGCYHVLVRDPNDGDSLGAYVVVRERGRLVVDLVATAALAAVPTDAAAGPGSFEMRELTPGDHDRLRRMQLDRPAGSPWR